MLRTLLGSVLGAFAALVIGWMLWGQTTPPKPAPIVQTVPTAPATGAVMSAPRPYQDLAARYRGPRVDVLEPASAEPIQLRYTPTNKRLHFAALISSSLADDGSPLMESDLTTVEPYRGLTCDRNCTEVEVLVQGPGAVRLLVPSGHRLVSQSLLIGDERQSVHMTRDGHPIAMLNDAVPILARYRTVAGPDPSPAAAPTAPAALPKKLRARARALRPKMIEDRVAALLEEVRARVRYDRTAEVSRQHTAALASGFVARTLAIGAGDCDVQNGLLVGLLHAAGVEARLAVGFIGVEGSTYPWLHAWVEFRDSSGTWQIADASDGAPAAAPPALPSPSVDPPVADASPSQPAPAEAAPERTVAPLPLAPEETPVPTVDEVPSEDGHTLLDVVAGLDTRYPWAVRGTPLLLFALAGWSILGARTSRAVKLDDTPDLSRLLRGVLQQPGAFAQMSALFTRAIVPCIGGKAISVNRARELAAASRLYTTASRPPLVRRAIAAKAIVLDGTTPEGSTVADSLGAIDLDRWAGWLDRATQSPLTHAVNATLAGRGEDWSVSLATSMPSAVTVLDLGALGAKLRQCPSSRVVLVDPAAPGIKRALAVSARTPKMGALILLDRLADRLDLDRPRRAALLSRAAKDALTESFPPSRA